MSILCKMNLHAWTGCKCKRCGIRRDAEHSWEGCLCTSCGTIQYQGHSWQGCKCVRCGSVRDVEHDWSTNCAKCAKCGQTRKNAHVLDGYTCVRCNAVCCRRCEAPLNAVAAERSGGLCLSCEKHFQSFLKATILSGSDESINSAAQTLRPVGLPLLVPLLAAVHSAVDSSKDLLPISQASAAYPKVSGAEKFALIRSKPFHDPDVPMLTFLKKVGENGLWHTDRSAITAAVKLISLAASHLVSDKTKAIDLVMKGQYKTAAKQYPEHAPESLEYVMSSLADAEAPGRYCLDNHVYREALEAMVATKSEKAAEYAIKHLNYDTVPHIAQLGPVVVQPLCRFAADKRKQAEERVWAIQALQILRDPSSLDALSSIARSDYCNILLTSTHVVNVGKAASIAVEAIRYSMNKDSAVPESPSQQVTSAPPPVSNDEVVIPPTTEIVTVSLPAPVDAGALEQMENHITTAIANLALNPRLRQIISSSPWDWHPAAISMKDSPSRTRTLVLTKIGRLLEEKGYRLGEAQFQIRYRMEGTFWERDFGAPTSVLRVEASIKDKIGSIKTPSWHLGAGVGRTSENEFLVWEWPK